MSEKEPRMRAEDFFKKLWAESTKEERKYLKLLHKKDLPKLAVSNDKLAKRL